MGSNDMPELGSRISLISKADIRYEGKLYTVDPQECTIALANVRSFGTEDRETAHPVPAQGQIYDYILFRATDIKDITVIPPQLLYDPAIVQLSALPSIGSRGGYQGSQATGGGPGAGGGGAYGHSVLGGIGGGAYQGGFNPMQSGLQTIGPRPAPPSELLPTSSSSNTNKECVLDLLTGSRSSTPGLRKVSPTVDQAIQANPRKLQSPPKDKQQQRNQQQLFPFRQRSGSGPQQHNLQRGNQPQQRNRNDSYQNYGNQQPNRQQQQQQQGGGSGGGRWGGGGGGGGRGIRGPMRGNRGRPFSRAPGTGTTKKPAQPLKFDADYDFDKANTEFEELRNQLAKVKIGDHEAAAGNVNQQNGGGEEKKDDSGNETGIGEGEQEETEVFYDKAKSFFDNISCEAIERSKGRSQRTDWRKERKLNSETFGVSMARRQGVYRGRGGYYSQQQRGGYYQGRGGGYRQQSAPTGAPFRQQQNKQNRPQPSVPQLPSQQGNQVGVGC